MSKCPVCGYEEVLPFHKKDVEIKADPDLISYAENMSPENIKKMYGFMGVLALFALLLSILTCLALGWELL